MNSSSRRSLVWLAPLSMYLATACSTATPAGTSVPDASASPDPVGDDTAVDSGRDEAAAAIVVSRPTSTWVRESGASAAFLVRLARKPTADVRIPVSSTDTTEGSVDRAELVFGADSWDADQTVIVRGVDDAEKDGNQHFAVVLGKASSTDPAYDGLGPTSIDFVNVDDETAAVTIDAADPITIAENGGSGAFSVHLESRPSSAVSIRFIAALGEAVTLSPDVITFDPATWSVPQSVVVSAIDNQVDAPDASVVLHASTSSADADYASLAPRDVRVTIVDDDVASLLVDTAPIALREADCASPVFRTVRLATKPLADVHVPIRSSSDAAAHPSVPALDFTPLNWDAPQSIAFTCTSDTIATGTRVSTIQVGPSTSSDPAYAAGLHADMAASTSDDDTAGMTLTVVGAPITTEAGGEAQLRFRLSSQPSDTVVVSVTSSNPAAATISPAVVTVAPADWQKELSFVAVGRDDATTHADVAYAAVATVVSAGSDAAYGAVAPVSLPLTHYDSAAHYLQFAKVGTAVGLQLSDVTADAHFVAATNAAHELVLFTRGTGDSSIESRGPNGEPVATTSAAIADDTQGAIVAFDGSIAGGPRQIYVRDRAAGQTFLVSAARAGGASHGASWSPSISGDGRFVAFASAADDLVDGDTNGAADVFVYDRQSKSIERISVGPGGIPNDGGISEVAIARDGSSVLFVATAASLVPGVSDRRDHLLEWSRATGAITVAAKTTSGEAVDLFALMGPTYGASASGSVVAFSAGASWLPGQPATVEDLYSLDRASGALRRLDTLDPSDFAYMPDVSPSGREAAYLQTAASTLMVRDLTTLALYDAYGIPAAYGAVVDLRPRVTDTHAVVFVTGDPRDVSVPRSIVIGAREIP